MPPLALGGLGQLQIDTPRLPVDEPVPNSDLFNPNSPRRHLRGSERRNFARTERHQLALESHEQIRALISPPAPEEDINPDAFLRDPDEAMPAAKFESHDFIEPAPVSHSILSDTDYACQRLWATYLFAELHCQRVKLQCSLQFKTFVYLVL